VREFGPRLAASARRLGVKLADAPDAVQEAFLAIHQHLADLKEKLSDGEFLAWATAIGRHKALDRFRGHRVELPARGDSWMQRLLAAVPDRAPADGADADHRDSDKWGLHREAIRRGLAQVEPKTREYGQPVAEVAKDLGMSGDAVYHAKYRVIALIRHELDVLVRERDALDP
jgi:DNA-directed RNA polymerase specialized sigma24 family protein